MTCSGKTTLAINLTRQYKRKGYGVLVLDPLLDKRWNADFITDDPNRFLESAKRSRNCKLFLDESGETVGRYNEQMFWLATRARHFGHQSHFITQRVVQLNRTCRDQASHLFVFRVSYLDAKTLAIDWSNPQLELSGTLDKFDFLYTTRFGDVQKFKVNPVGVQKYGRIITARSSSVPTSIRYEN